MNNPELRGLSINKIGTAILFTFSSLFFAHREKVCSNLTRLVLVIWLLVVLILNSSYTVSLAFVLTILLLKPNVSDINWLKRNNPRAWCDGDSFVGNYLKHQNINRYKGQFDKNQNSAAFLELPHQKALINTSYIATADTFEFGGLGFVFQKGSLIATNVTNAILKLPEYGELVSLECSDSTSNDNAASLSLRHSWGLYIICAAISTICLVLLLLLRLLSKYRVRHQEEGHGNLSLWSKTIELAKYLYNGKAVVESGSPPPPTSADIDEDWRALSWVSESPPHPRIPESFPHNPDDQRRISESFPRSPDDTRIHAIQLTFLNSVPR